MKTFLHRIQSINRINLINSINRFLTPLTHALAALFLGLLLAACQSPKPAAQPQAGTQKVPKPSVVYVTDFELQAQNIEHQEGMLSSRPGPAGRVGDRLSGASEDPAARARQLVDLMTKSLLKELAKAGFNAQYLAPGAQLPQEGWLLRGAFAKVQEGNRLQRSMVGFGQGQTDLKLVTAVNDLSQGAPKSLYQLEAEATSGSKPGAAPTLVLGPYGAAVRFVRSGQDLDKNVKQAAAEIVAGMAQQTQ